MKNTNGVYGGSGQFYKKYAILDEYNYSFFRSTDLERGTDDVIVSVRIQSTRDATISDILSEIADCSNFVYVEGEKYIYQTSTLEEDYNETGSRNNWLVLVLKPEGENNK